MVRTPPPITLFSAPNSGILGGAWNLNNGGSSSFNVSTPIGGADA